MRLSACLRGHYVRCLLVQQPSWRETNSPSLKASAKDNLSDALTFSQLRLVGHPKSYRYPLARWRHGYCRWLNHYQIRV